MMNVTKTGVNVLILCVTDILVLSDNIEDINRILTEVEEG